MPNGEWFFIFQQAPLCPVNRLHCTVLCLQDDPWVTMRGSWPLLTHTKNCTLIEVTEEEVENVVKHVPKLDTLVSPHLSAPCNDL